jgi:hypothetical protein
MNNDLKYGLWILFMMGVTAFIAGFSTGFALGVLRAGGFGG